jgi:MFS family permease
VPHRDRLVRRSTAFLSGAQVALWGAIGVFAAFGVLASSELSGLHGAAAILFGLYYLSAAAGARIAGRFMDRRGRRPGLVAGYAVLAVSGVVAFAATRSGSFGLLLASGVILGMGAGAALLGRAAVADMYPPQERGRAVGRLVVAGTVGAVGGPPLGSAVNSLAERLTGIGLAFPWLLVTVLALAAMALVGAVRPDPRDLAVGPTGAAAPRRVPRVILQLRPAAVAVVAVGIGQAVMVTFMSVVPVLVREHGAAPLTVSVVVSIHLAGMFALSQPIGVVLDRWGRRAGLLGGALTSVAGVALGLASTSTPVATVGLFLIGVGWSAAYLGSTAVVSDLSAPSERAGALGLTDLIAAISAAIGVFGGAALLEGPGFTVLSVVALGLLAAPVALLVPLREPSRMAASGEGAPEG